MCICICMGLTRYQTCINILKKYTDATKRDYIYTQDLRNLIIKFIGSNDRVVLATLKMLREQGVIKEIKINKWKIDLKGG